jgi:hypothetical protein
VRGLRRSPHTLTLRAAHIALAGTASWSRPRRRWRISSAEEASTDETPQRLAKEALLFSLWGLSPAAISSVAA